MGKVPGTFFLRPCLLPSAGFGVPINAAAPLGAASVSTFTDAKDVNLMAKIDIATPVSSAPSDRLALGVGLVRPGVAGIGGTLNPSSGGVAVSAADFGENAPEYSFCRENCFEGSEE
jgi:hypothetical protein